MTPVQNGCLQRNAYPWAAAAVSIALLTGLPGSAKSQTQERSVAPRIARDDPGGPDNRADVRPASIVPFIPAGTVIADRAPAGWTHLIDKSRPKMHYGDVDRVPKPVQALSGMFFTSLLARVSPPDGREHAGYWLDQVAIGMGTKIGNNDTIITPETQSQLGARLGLLPRIALDARATNG